MAFLFEKLAVYQKAVDFADQVTALTEKFPRGGNVSDKSSLVSLEKTIDVTLVLG